MIFFTCFLTALGYAQEGVDFTKGRIQITVNPESRTINGSVNYKFNTSLRTDSIFLDARKMTINEVRINRKRVEFHYQDDLLTVYRKLKSDKEYDLQIAYSAKPQKAVYFIGWEDEATDMNQVWTQGQGKYSSHWVPSFDNMSEKVEFDLEISFKKGY